MSVAEAIGQMQRIEAQLALLAPPRPASTGGAAFASALSSASSATQVASTTDISGLAAHGVTGDDVVRSALQYEGVPYVLGGESKSGIDCSALVQRAYGDLGVEVPRLVSQQQHVGEQVASLKDAKPGDLIVLDGADHIAIWMGDGKAIHAPYAGRTVSVQKAWFDDADITTIRRVVPDAAAADTGALSAATVARATALMGMASATGTGDTTSLASMLGGFGTGAGGTLGSAGTAQQLFAARSALLGTGV